MAKALSQKEKQYAEDRINEICSTALRGAKGKHLDLTKKVRSLENKIDLWDTNEKVDGKKCPAKITFSLKPASEIKSAVKEVLDSTWRSARSIPVEKIANIVKKEPREVIRMRADLEKLTEEVKKEKELVDATSRRINKCKTEALDLLWLDNDGRSAIESLTKALSKAGLYHA